MPIATIDAVGIDRDTTRFIETFLQHAGFCAAGRDDLDAVLQSLRSALIATVAVRAEDQRRVWRRVYFEVCSIACAAPPFVESAESVAYVQAFLRENVDLLGAHPA